MKIFVLVVIVWLTDGSKVETTVGQGASEETCAYMLDETKRLMGGAMDMVGEGQVDGLDAECQVRGVTW